MKIALEEERCEGYGFCEDRAGDMFRLDDDGMLQVLRDEVDGQDLERARAAVRSCPVAALKLLP